MDYGTARLRVDTAGARSLAIPLAPGGPQPSHFGAPAARAEPLAANGFVGDTRSGGSCNCESVTLVPHCNGTHTEGVGHVTRERVSVHDAALAPLVPAALVSVSPEPAGGNPDTADPPPREGDVLITAAALQTALSGLPRLEAAAPDLPALVVRTLPNGPEKTRRDWMSPPMAPYFSLEAMDLIVSLGVRHLLTDLPSVDRLLDEGRLAGHRRYWALPPGSTDPAEAGRPGATITEMIYVPDDLPDGLYALSLQVAAWSSDAAPSRPVLCPLEEAP